MLDETMQVLPTQAFTGILLTGQEHACSFNIFCKSLLPNLWTGYHNDVYAHAGMWAAQNGVLGIIVTPGKSERLIVS
jgi:hypothetical protein